MEKKVYLYIAIVIGCGVILSALSYFNPARVMSQLWRWTKQVFYIFMMNVPGIVALIIERRPIKNVLSEYGLTFKKISWRWMLITILSMIVVCPSVILFLT
ncbi:MAG: hypothetical protein LUF90_03115 [Rikenellaceae bacterium]|nr:hypothetical protein [Rikenellaceae bacterium]